MVHVVAYGTGLHPRTVSTQQTPTTSSARSLMPTPPSSPAYGRAPPFSTGPKSSPVSRAHWNSASRRWRNSRRCRRVARYGRCAPSSLDSPNGCEYETLSGLRHLFFWLNALRVCVSSNFAPAACFRDYYAALLRTHHSFVAPTQGKLLNYVQRVALGVVAQITVRPSRIIMERWHSNCQKLAV